MSLCTHLFPRMVGSLPEAGDNTFCMLGAASGTWGILWQHLLLRWLCLPPVRESFFLCARHLRDALYQTCCLFSLPSGSLCFISTWSCPFGKAVPELFYLFSSSQSLRSFVLFGCVGHVHAFSPALGTSVHREPVLSVWHCDTLFPVLSLAFPWCSFMLTSLL